MTVYIIKSSVSLLLMFGLYWFLLRQEKLFAFNRFFLLFAILFSLVIPFISIHVNLNNTEFQRNNSSVFNIISPVFNPEQNLENITSTQSSSAVLQSRINISLIMIFLYFIGVTIFLFRFLKNIFFISRQIELSEKASFSGHRLALVDNQINPHCFFNTIFVNKDDYLNNKIERELLSHEIEHIKQSHSLDVLLVEFIKIIYWFNPLLLLYNRAIRINHEYLADNDIIRDSSDIKSYSDILINFIGYKNNIPLTTGFNQSLTRKRLLMLTKSNPNKVNVGFRFLMTLILVVGFTLLMSFKNSNAQPIADFRVAKNGEQVVNDVKGFVVNKFGKYLKGVSIMVSGKNTGVRTDEMGHFIISKIPEDAILTFSFSEYVTQTLKPVYSSEMVVNLIIDHEIKDAATAKGFFPEQGTNPLIVIDGSVVESVTMAEIDPNNKVSSIKVLKGKNSIIKYGKKGKNGAIEINAMKEPNEKKPTSSNTSDSKEPKTKPLIIVDGALYNGELNDIPINEVDKLSVINYTTAYDKYGVKGREKVIEIITKKKAANINKN